MAASMARVWKAFVFLSCMAVLATCFWLWELRVAQRKSSGVRSSLTSVGRGTTNHQEKFSGDSCTVPVTNLEFSKVDDIVSERTANILLRFAYNHHMAICNPMGADHLLIHSGIYKSDCHQNEGKSNTILIHRPMAPGDTYIIGTISEPETSFLLQFFDKDNLKVLGLENHPNPFGAYLGNPEIYERSTAKGAPQGWVGQGNKQALQLGFPPDLLKTQDTNIMDSAIKQLNELYTFVIIGEYYEESLVMLRRRLCLDFSDILHSSTKIHEQQNPEKYIPLTDKQSENHKRINTIDYRMYDFFNRTFWKGVQEEEARGFWEEVVHFRKLVTDVNEYCSEDNEVPIVEFPATRWNRRLLINHRFCKELKRTSGKWTKEIIVQAKNNLI